MTELLDNLPLVQVFLITLLISVGYLGGMFTTLHSVQQTYQEPNYNLSCPKPVIKPEIQTSNPASNERDELRTGSETQNYIQNPETEINYEKNKRSVEVGVDAVSKPEGMSMRPTIFTGNTVLLQEYNGKELESGQIIRYKSAEGGYVIHRIRASYLDTEGYLLVQGDNTESEERVEKEKITHRVKGVLYT